VVDDSLSRRLLKVKPRLSKHGSHERRLVSDPKDSSTDVFLAILVLVSPFVLWLFPSCRIRRSIVLFCSVNIENFVVGDTGHSGDAQVYNCAPASALLLATFCYSLPSPFCHQGSAYFARHESTEVPYICSRNIDACRRTNFTECCIYIANPLYKNTY
jgi:hypothetical protein